MNKLIRDMEKQLSKLYIAGKLTEEQEQNAQDLLYEIKQILDEDNEDENDEVEFNQNDHLN